MSSFLNLIYWLISSNFSRNCRPELILDYKNLSNRTIKVVIFAVNSASKDADNIIFNTLGSRSCVSLGGSTPQAALNIIAAESKNDITY
jgi:hypothetical protein